MGALDVNPADLLRFADAYSELATRAAQISPQAAQEVQRIADTHGLMGYPTAVGIAAGLAKAEGPLQAKVDDFDAYAQRLTEHAATYTSADGGGAAKLDGLDFDPSNPPPDGHAGDVHEAGFGEGGPGIDGGPVPLDTGGGIEFHRRWTDKDLFPHPPSAADIKQDSVGDCYFDAAIGAIAEANPQWIKDRVHFDEDNNSFDVTLWNGHAWQHITVTQDDIQTDIDHHGASWLDNGQPNAPLWPSVMESAYAKLQCPGDDLGHALDYGIGRGGSAPDALQALTGNRGVSIDPREVWWTNQHIDQSISGALASHQPVTISTTPTGGPLLSTHVYIVEGISGSGSDAQLTLRNPWGGNPNDPGNPLIQVRLGDVIGSGPTGKFGGLGTHPTFNVNIGELGK